MIPATVYNYDYLGQCSDFGVNAYGQASTSSMIPPTVTYNSSGSTSTTFQGSATDPIPLIAFSLDWNVPLTLSEPSPTVLHIEGSLNGTCYPAHEVSMGARSKRRNLSTHVKLFFKYRPLLRRSRQYPPANQYGYSSDSTSAIRPFCCYTCFVKG